MSNWIMYGRAERSAYGGQWVKIADGTGEYRHKQASAWWNRVPVWDEIKTEWK